MATEDSWDMNTDNRTRSILESVDLGNQSGDEVTFGDWHLIDNLSSDDESIEVIEREVLCSIQTPVARDSESDTNRECNKERDIDYESGHRITNDIFATNDCTSKIEHSYNDVDRSPCEIISSMAVSRRRHSRDWVVEHVEEVPTTNFITKKLIFSFVLGVLASFVIHQYEDIIPSFQLPWNTEADSEFSLLKSLPFSTYMNFHRAQYEKQNKLKVDDRNDVVIMLTSYIENQKRIIDNVFREQLNFLKMSRLLKGNIYQIHVPDIHLLPRQFSNLLENVNKIEPCLSNISRDQLPVVCEENKNFWLLVGDSQLISIHHAIKGFFDMSKDEVKKLQLTVLNTLSKPVHNYESVVRNTDSFMSDCDSFSKRYKSNTYCLRTLTQCDGDSRKEENPSMTQKTKRAFKLSSNRFSWNTFVGKKKSETLSKLNQDMAIELRTLIEKLKKKFEDFYRMYDSVENIEREEVVSERNFNASDIDRNANLESTEEKQAKKPLSAEWFFNLNEAREKLRNYYNTMISGDWILKLGKAREKLRMNLNRKDMWKRPKYEPKMTKTEKLGNSINKMVTKFKVKLKKSGILW